MGRAWHHALFGDRRVTRGVYHVSGEKQDTASYITYIEIFGFLGPGYRGTNLKSKKNKIGISFSLWDANGDKFVIFAVSGSRDIENRIPH